MSVYFVPAGIQKTRLNIMQKGTSKLGLNLALKYDKNVKYVVSELNCYDTVMKILQIKVDLNVHFVKTSWFFDSMKAGYPLNPSTYFLQRNDSQLVPDVKKEHTHLCQTRTLLDHKNKKYVKALEILAQEAEMKNEDAEDSRALAFRKAAGVLKQFPKEINRIEDVQELTGIGQHSLTILQEIVNESFSEEACRIESSEWFQTMKLFMSVYGIGPTKANRLYNEGLRTLKDIVKSATIKLDKRMRYGLQYHDDLSTPVTKFEADKLLDVVSVEAKTISQNVVLYLTGGFSRGKETGHDVDILISHRDEGGESGLLDKLCQKLHHQGLILHQDVSYRKTRNTPDRTMDNFDKSFIIFRMPLDVGGTIVHDNLSRKNELHKQWIARRVDLIVCSQKELPFARVGWIGSKLFNRSLRNYAKKEQNMKLTSHGLYDMTTNSNVDVTTEEQLFSVLKLPFLQPYERNL